MRVLVTGASGLLGVEVVDRLRTHGHEPIPKTHAELDISEPESVAQIGAESFGRLDWCINCAAYTAVDRAESEERQAYEANALGISYLGSVCGIANVKLLHISTDFVFDGTKGAPYVEDDPVNPIGVYGRTKLGGERALSGNHLAVVVRASWLFGPRGNCFPKAILKAFDAGQKLRVVADQIGTPTYTPFLADVLCQAIERNPFPGLYHAAGSDVMSWFSFAERIVKACRGKEQVIEPIDTEDWPTPAKRPPYSALASNKLSELGACPMPGIDRAISDFFGAI